MTREKFQTLLTCPHCQSLGAATWEENAGPNPGGVQRRLIQLHGEFHSETGRTHSGDPLIVCNGCDAIQED